ncbi:MAG: glycosyltransferase [Alphaproteobacteria bacterium]
MKNPMSCPDISVIIPCYNAERWVGHAIQSVLDQKGVAVEVIVIDDGSTDGSLDVIKSFGDRIRFETGPNRGVCAARNRGIALSCAPYLNFLDADDYVEGHFFSAGLTAMRSNSAEFGVGPKKYLGQTVLATRVPPLGPDWYKVLKWLRSPGVGAQQDAMILARTLVDRAGGWNSELERAQDLEFVVRCLTYRPSVATWEQGAAVYRLDHSGEQLRKRVDDRSLAFLIKAHRLAHSHLLAAGLEPEVAGQLSQYGAYRVARIAARNGSRKAAVSAERLWRDVGGRKHPGSRAGSMVARLFGLYTKERLAPFVRRIRLRTFFMN